jgi:hypothetical protein
VQVKSFGDATKASQYVKNLSQDPDAFKNIDEASINVFAITQENYIRFLGDKDINKYLAFYRKNYE